MKEAIVSVTKDSQISSRLIDSPTPQPSPTQVLIKVVVSGSNPKDYKVPLLMPENNHTNSGDDVAGIVHAVGSQVTEFRVGDRVAAFHEMRTPGGSYAEYAIAPEHTTFHLPAHTSFEEAAAIPLCALTAADGLFSRLGVPEPWVATQTEREKTRGGVVVYGAASAVGAYAIKFLRKADIHPIIAVAGRGMDFVEGLIDRSKGDTIVDYREGDEKVVQGLKNGVKPGEKLMYAFDAVSEHGSYGNIVQVLASGGHLTVVLPGKKYEGIPDDINLTLTQVSSVHKDNKLLGAAWTRLIGLGLKDGWFSGHPTKTIDGGLAGVGKALADLRDGKASATKYVFKISDTEGVAKSVV